ncbi:hypothetical protein KKP04_03560 [Rhodomicrobium sp. Az07]|uniref:hypothetical protein n=1 Tax=Rhodomicrobium sp. Az07 TaxID=2839034 RepID=UPI001BEA3EBD|nr:hypothetical protein [Rhodomicrobium sp. Az07]MBT3069945.1 hypothetical protein [Rhodomicrobium sp. Az07]
MRNVIDLIVFTPSIAVEYGQKIKTLVEQAANAENLPIRVTTWDKYGDFFDPANRYPLNESWRSNASKTSRWNGLKRRQDKA